MSAPAAARLRAASLPLGLFVAWAAATWVLEGRIRTLLRPEAVLDRTFYAVVANVLLGTLGAVWVVRWRIAGGHVTREQAGFGSPARSAAAAVAGLALGLGFYVAQGAPALAPVVLANAFAQVLVTSIAEVLVCWAVVGAAVDAALRGRGWGRMPAGAAAAVVASLLFGLYHYAHSPPFNTHALVARLTAVSLVTSVAFLVSRDVYGTLAFHNWLGVFGVVNAMRSAGALGAFSEPRAPLLGMGALGLAVLVTADRLWVRRRVEPASGRQRP